MASMEEPCSGYNNSKLTAQRQSVLQVSSLLALCCLVESHRAQWQGFWWSTYTPLTLSVYHSPAMSTFTAMLCWQPAIVHSLLTCRGTYCCTPLHNYIEIIDKRIISNWLYQIKHKSFGQGRDNDWQQLTLNRFTYVMVLSSNCALACAIWQSLLTANCPRLSLWVVSHGPASTSCVRYALCDTCSHRTLRKWLPRHHIQLGRLL